MPHARELLSNAVAIILLIGGILFAVQQYKEPTSPPLSYINPITEHTASSPLLTAEEAPTKDASLIPSSTTTLAENARVEDTETLTPSPSTPGEIRRIEKPYATAPLSFETINVSTRSALVNIYCASPSSGTLKPITGSGAIIDPRGIILTNAHVAQYVLIAQSGKTDLYCHIRTGAPAKSTWTPVVLYLPPVWIEQHAADITKSNALGTGEHDFALLTIASGINGAPLPESFPALAVDSREAIGFVDDSVLTASYPVEFVGGGVIQSNLYPVTSLSTIQKLLTFGGGMADAFSLGGIIQAQKGASGGVVVNQWNRAIGLVTTTSDGATTGERDLHAITVAYINRDILALTGKSLGEILAPSPIESARVFENTEAARLTQLLIDQIAQN